MPSAGTVLMNGLWSSSSRLAWPSQAGQLKHAPLRYAVGRLLLIAEGDSEILGLERQPLDFAFSLTRLCDLGQTP